MMKIKRTVLLLLVLSVLAASFALPSCSSPAKTKSGSDSSTDSPQKAAHPFVMSEKIELYNDNLLYTDDVVIRSSDDASWILKENKKKKFCDYGISDFITDGNIIYYVKDATDEEADEEANEETDDDIGDEKYEIRSIKTDGSQDTLVDEITLGESVNLLNYYKDSIYFFNYNGVFKYDLKNKSKKTIYKGEIRDKKLINNTFYFIDYNKKDKLFCLDCKIDKFRKETLKLKLKKDDLGVYKILYDNGILYLAVENNGTDDIYRYNLEKNNIKLITQLDSTNYIDAIDNNSLYYRIHKDSLSPYYFDNHEIYEYKVKDLKTGKTSIINSLICGSDILVCKKGLVFHVTSDGFNAKNKCFYFDNNNISVIDNIDKDDTIYQCDGENLYCYSSETNSIKKVKMELKKAPVYFPETVKTSIKKENEYVYTASESDYKSEYNNKKYKNRMPQLSIKSDDAKRINAEIQIAYGIVGIWSKEYENNEAEAQFDYKCFINDDVLSLIIEEYLDRKNEGIVFGGNPYRMLVFNINTKTGKRLDNDKIIALSTIDKAEADNQLKQIVTNRSGDNHPNEISDYMLSLSRYYFNENGELTVCYFYYKKTIDDDNPVACDYSPLYARIK